MSVQRWFTVESGDAATAAAAFLAALAAACPPGVAAYVPTTWQDAVDVPAEVVNPYLAPSLRLAAGEWMRFDFALLPTSDGSAFAVNMLVSAIGSRAGQEGAFGTALTAYWRSQAGTTRPVSAAVSTQYPQATPPACWQRSPGAVVVRLLQASPAFPRCVFAGTGG